MPPHFRGASAASEYEPKRPLCVILPHLVGPNFNEPQNGSLLRAKTAPKLPKQPPKLPKQPPIGCFGSIVGPNFNDWEITEERYSGTKKKTDKIWLLTGLKQHLKSSQNSPTCSQNGPWFPFRPHRGPKWLAFWKAKTAPWGQNGPFLFTVLLYG